MSYDKINHAIISRINPKINPTLKQGYSSVCTGTSDIILPVASAGATVDVANSVFTGCTPFSYATVPATSYRIRVSAGEINKLVLDDGTILIPTPNGFKDVSGNENHSTSTTMTMTHLSDSSVFYLEEYGFATDAVNNCYPILANRSGYAGLDSGDVVKSFPRGLISRKGSIDIEAWNLLDTLIDFGNSTAVKATGLRISEMDGVDCNLELIYVAEPKLDPAEIAILVPSTGAEVQLDTNFTVSGTSNCANVKIEASADGTTWVELEDSLAVTAGAFSKADCQLSSDDFDVNDTITLRVSDVDSVSNPDTVTIGTIATITMNAITDVTATVAKTISGFTNGASVNIYYKLHSAGSWTLAGAGTVDTGAKTWSYSLTIATAGTYDIKVVDGTDADAYAQQDDVSVASGEIITYFISESGNNLTDELGNKFIQ